MSRMPPVEGKNVVPTHAVARMLGWSTTRVRSIDDILRPIRLADGSRAYDIDRVLCFVQVWDSAPPVPCPIVVSTAEYKRLRQQWRRS